jgi:hypothetical protein
MTIFRLVGGSDVKPTAAAKTARAPHLSGAPPHDDRPSTETLSTTAENGRLREQRKEAWREAEAVTRYWRTRLDFHDAVEIAQRRGISEGRSHPAAADEDRWALVNGWRAAFVIKATSHASAGWCIGCMEAKCAGQGQISAYRLKTRAPRACHRQRSGISRRASGASINPQIGEGQRRWGSGMSELTPKDVLADLFSDPDFAIAIFDPAQAAEIVIQRLLDAGFEIVSAKGGEA